MTNNLDRQYKELLEYIINFGNKKSDRTGTGTLSTFGYQIRHKMSEGFPILTTKRIHFSSVVTELLWFLNGDTNIKYLIDNNCNIWNGDAYKKYIDTTNKYSGMNPNDCGFRDINQLLLFGAITGPISNAEFRQYTLNEFIDKIKTDKTFADTWGDLGPIYGKQWKRWGEKGNIYSEHNDYTNGIDQIMNLINDLKNNPDSRRMMVNAWNVAEIDKMTLPPCHYGFQVYTRELSYSEYDKFPIVIEIKEEKRKLVQAQEYTKAGELRDFERNIYELLPKRAISLMWNQRSVDTFLGLPFNLASYGLLLEILAKEVNMVPDELICNLGDTHLYLSDHIEGAKEQITRTPYTLPKLEISKDIIRRQNDCIPVYKNSDFTLINYISHPKINATLSN